MLRRRFWSSCNLTCRNLTHCQRCKEDANQNDAQRNTENLFHKTPKLRLSEVETQAAEKMVCSNNNVALYKNANPELMSDWYQVL